MNSDSDSDSYSSVLPKCVSLVVDLLCSVVAMKDNKAQAKGLQPKEDFDAFVTQFDNMPGTTLNHCLNG